MKVSLNIKYIRLIRKIIPYLATTIATLGKSGYKRSYWEIFSKKIYTNRFLQKIKVLSNEGDVLALMRPFSLDDVLFDDIFKHKVYEIYGSPKKGDIVIDIGAHIGLFTIRASQLVGSKGKVIAIEPNTDNFSMLLSNIKLNNLSNVIPINIAIADYDGRIKLYIDEDTTTGHSIIFHKSKKFIKVPCMTLDSLITILGLHHVDFIKMDVEGAEYVALLGMKGLLSSSYIRLSIEASHDKHIREKCIKFLRQMGFLAIERKIRKDFFIYSWRPKISI